MNEILEHHDICTQEELHSIWMYELLEEIYKDYLLNNKEFKFFDDVEYILKNCP